MHISFLRVQTLPAPPDGPTLTFLSPSPSFLISARVFITTGHWWSWFHLWPNRLKGTRSRGSLWRGTAGRRRMGAGPEEDFLTDYSLTFSCLVGRFYFWVAPAVTAFSSVSGATRHVGPGRGWEEQLSALTRPQPRRPASRMERHSGSIRPPDT